jgi:AcrR family transcriptional regulator
MGKATARRRGRPKDRGLTERRRAEILDAAALVFAQRGYRGTDVQVVADAIRVGKGTVYRYFPTKRALFLGAADRAMRRLSEHIDERVADVPDPVDQIAEAVRAYLAFFDAHPEYVELLIQERAEFKDRKKPTYLVHRDANIAPWEELMRGLIRAGRLRGVPVPRVTGVMGALLHGTIFTNHFAGRRRSFAQQADDILDVVFRGILADSERCRRRTAGRA